ncbi:hypothetical protein ACE1OC_10660 [Streptomyces sp. DSM 116496]|uniref:hypothetical protein n=1 Tax=Streptomyces stoeckheimensis TaxID=3344656 RepID=UPI0038B3D769
MSAKRSITALGATLGIAASTFFAAPAAQAADGSLEHVYVVSSSVGSDGAFRVKFQSYEGWSVGNGLAVRVREKGTGAVVARVGGFDSGVCGDEDCSYSNYTSAPATLDKMAAYDLEVVRNEGQSNEEVAAETGVLNYAINPKIEGFASSVPSLSYDSRSGQSSGRVVAEDPKTRQVRPLAGAEVKVQAYSGEAAQLTTDGAGRFAGPFAFRGDEREAHLLASLVGSESVWSKLPLPIRKQATKLNVSSPGATVTARFGTKIPVRGTLTRTADDGTQKPLDEGLAVTKDGCVVAYREDCGNGVGGFRVTGDAKMTVGFSSAWFEPSSSSFAVHATHMSAFEGLVGHVDQYRNITYTGKLIVKDGTVPAGATARVHFDFSGDNGKTWTYVGSTTTTYNTPFTLKSPYSSAKPGLWRLRHGTANVGPTTSQTFQFIRRPTQLTADDVTPEGVTRGTTITAKGLLTHRYSTTWKPFAGQTVRIYFKPATPGSAWKQLGTAKTLANGTFSRKFTADQDGTWQMRYDDAPATHYASKGREDYVDVR